MAYELRGEVLVWLIETVACLLTANRGSTCLLTRATDGRIVRCGIISSCQSAATSEIVKALLATSSSHVRSAIASTKLYYSGERNFANYVWRFLFRGDLFVSWMTSRSRRRRIEAF